MLSGSEISFNCLVATVLIFIIAASAKSLVTQQTNTQKRFQEWKIENKRDCSDYLNSIKTSSITASYSTAGAASITLFVFGMMTLLNISSRDKYVISAFTLIASFAIIYKLYGCFLYRNICGLEYCKQ